MLGNSLKRMREQFCLNIYASCKMSFLTMLRVELTHFVMKLTAEGVFIVFSLVWFSKRVNEYCVRWSWASKTFFIERMFMVRDKGLDKSKRLLSWAWKREHEASFLSVVAFKSCSARAWVGVRFFSFTGSSSSDKVFEMLAKVFHCCLPWCYISNIMLLLHPQDPWCMSELIVFVVLMWSP